MIKDGHTVGTFDLRSLRIGDRLHIVGDDTDDTFVCIAQREGGPVGTLTSNIGDLEFMFAQLLGMAPWNLNETGFAVEFEPGVLKCEYGSLVVMTTTQSLSHDISTLCCSSFMYVPASVVGG